MIDRSVPTSVVFAIAAALTLAACGGDSESTATADDPTIAEVEPDTTVDATTTSAPATTGAAEPEEADGGCNQVLTAEEFESILGRPVEVTGSGQVCNLILASDSVGTLQVFSGSKADEALDINLTKFRDNDGAGRGGVLLAGDSGFADSDGVVVRGSSGRVFVLGIPDNATEDNQAAAQALADLLLTR